MYNFLQELLANQNILLLRARNAHWNIIGPDFKSAHSFFEELYNKFHEDIDSIAERIRKLEFVVSTEFINFQTLKNEEPTNYDSQTLIIYIYDGLFEINTSIKNQLIIADNEDFGTINYLNNLFEENEKTLWFLKSHLI